MANFAATVSEWARKTPERMQAVRNRAIEKMGEDMALTKPQGGRVPFDTGNLARSLMASTSGMQGVLTGQSVGAVTATLPLTKAIWLGYQAEYARRMNYGLVGPDSLGRVYNQAGNYFVEGAISKWTQFVDEAARELQT